MICLITSAFSKCITDNAFKEHFLAFHITGHSKTAFVLVFMYIYIKTL